MHQEGYKLKPLYPDEAIMDLELSERPFVLFPIGYPAADATVPDLRRKELDEVALWNPRPADALPSGDGD